MKRVNEGSIKDLIITISERVADAYLEKYGTREINKLNAIDKDHLDRIAETILNSDELELYDNSYPYIVEQIKDILEVDEVIGDIKGYGRKFEGPAFSRDHDLDVNLDLGEPSMPIDEKYMVPRLLDDDYAYDDWGTEVANLINNEVNNEDVIVILMNTFQKRIEKLYLQGFEPHEVAKTMLDDESVWKKMEKVLRDEGIIESVLSEDEDLEENTEYGPKTEEIIDNIVRQSVYKINKNIVTLEDLDELWEMTMKPHQFALYNRHRDLIHSLISDQLNDVNESIYWPEEVRDYPEDDYDEDDDVPYPGGLSQDDYDEDIDQNYYVPRLIEAYGRKRWSITRVENEILEALAERLGVSLHKGNRKKQEDYAQKVTSQFYHIGDVPIMVRDIKVAGMGADDVEVWVLNKEKPSSGIKLNPMISYEGIDEKVKDQLGDTFVKQDEEKSDDPVEIEKRVYDFIEGTSHNLSDEEAFDLVGDFLKNDKIAREYIRRDMKYADPEGWLANQI